MVATAGRLALYAILNAIEEDLRRVVMGSEKELLAANVEAHEAIVRAVDRVKKDTEANDAPDFPDLIEYLDYGDTFVLINTFADCFSPNIREYIRSRTWLFEKITPIRNRVMHSRPLLPEDFAFLNDAGEEMRRENRTLWRSLNAILERLRAEPEFVFGLTIPAPPDESRLLHNLPIPEFDETGFIGRKRDVQALAEALAGPYPVISIIGEGGLGKTALALRASYDLLDKPNCPFDAMVWTTAKTKQLTVHGIVELEGAIRDSLGLVKDVTKTLDIETKDDPLAGLLEYLKQFRVLVILDNLETIVDDRLKLLFQRLPAGSKLVVTSRIGLGAFDFPLRLQPMTDVDAVGLFRAIAKMRRADSLVSLPNDRVLSLCKKMKNNPGWIRWFIAAVQAGARPEEVLQNSDRFLDYCMSNVYDHLDRESQKVLTAMMCVPRALNQAELSQLVVMSTAELQFSLQRLLSANMIKIENAAASGFESVYVIGELSRDYLQKHHPPYPSDAERYGKRWATMVVRGEEVKASFRSRPYDVSAIKLRSDRDLVVARLLQQSYQTTTAQLAEASTLIEDAKQLAPDYFEVHRAEAWVRWRQRNFLAAKEAYETAIELEPAHAPLRFHFAGLLLRDLDDLDGANFQLNEAAKLDPSSAEVKLELSRVTLFRHDYGPARTMARGLLGNPTTSEWMSRKIWDVLLSIEERAAWSELQGKNHSRTLDFLEQMRAVFQEIPAHLRDDHMLEKLRRGHSAALTVKRIATTEETRERAAGLAKWLAGVAAKVFTMEADQSGFHLGRIKSLGRTGDFGFIFDLEGHDWYFSMRDVNVEDRPRLQQGTTVSFWAGTNPLGPCARRVALTHL